MHAPKKKCIPYDFLAGLHPGAQSFAQHEEAVFEFPDYIFRGDGPQPCQSLVEA